MNPNLVRNGFIAAALMNIGGVLLFSRAFTSDTINQQSLNDEAQTISY